MWANDRDGGGDDFGSVNELTSSLDDVVATGKMIKQGHFVKSWKVRIFVLSGYNLTYYDEARNRKGIFDLTGCTVHALTPQECGVRADQRPFSIQGPGKILKIGASTDQNRQAWMDAIEKQIERYKGIQKFLLVGEVALGNNVVKESRAMGLSSSTARLLLTTYHRCLVLEADDSAMRSSLWKNGSNFQIVKVSSDHLFIFESSHHLPVFAFTGRQ